MMDFHSARKTLLDGYNNGSSGLGFCRDYARLMDGFIREIFERAAQGHDLSGLALGALGGYGRGDMAPWSDVDLVFLTASTADQKKFAPIIEKTLYPLWDLKLDVGHAVRTPGQCLDLARDDFATLSTQLDARFLAGDESLFEEFKARQKRLLGSKARKQAFVKDLRESVKTRHSKYGQSPYLLEPNVKEGQGALRDIHAIFWGGRGLFGDADLDDLAEKGFLPKDRVEALEEAREFMTGVRIHLHKLAAEKTDTLSFELQEDVSRALGFKADEHVSGVERFMQEYYTRVYLTKSVLDYFLSRASDNLMPSRLRRLTDRPRHVEKGLSIRRGLVELGGRSDILRRPSLLMRAFEVSAHSGLPISQRTLDLIRTNLDLVDDDYRSDPAALKAFFKGLTAVPPVRAKNLTNISAIQVLHLLEAFIPELAGVRAQVQHNAYHVYTVDVHLVITVWELKKISRGTQDPEVDRFDLEVMNQVEDLEVLFLAALVHDIGKGAGDDHARIGAEMAPGIAARMGFEAERGEDLAFLVAEHLFLAEVAMRRDLTEERIIVTCARRVGSVDRLHMLYLLTVADSRATGPGALTNWKLTLIRDLYSKIYRVLTRSDLALKETSHRTNELLIQVAKTLEDRLPSAEVDRHLEKMSAHYLSVMTADEVVRHILLERELGDRALIWEVEEKEEGYCEVTVVTHDRPGLLSRMAGVFTLHNINILGAEVFTRANNIALDIFQVDHPPDRVYAAEAWEKVKRDAERVLTGKMALDFRLARKRPLLNGKKTVTSRPDKVVVDNDVSDFHTIVEIYTYDRLGLLYAVTQTLYDLQLSINIAKISTKVEQVVDVFYVRDFFGEKISDKDQIRELKEALLFTLNR